MQNRSYPFALNSNYDCEWLIISRTGHLPKTVLAINEPIITTNPPKTGHSSAVTHSMASEWLRSASIARSPLVLSFARKATSSTLSNKELTLSGCGLFFQSFSDLNLFCPPRWLEALSSLLALCNPCETIGRICEAILLLCPYTISFIHPFRADYLNYYLQTYGVCEWGRLIWDMGSF